MSQIDLMTVPPRSSRPALTVAVGQFTSIDDVDANLDSIDRIAQDAAASGAQLIVFPEASMYAWHSPSEELSRVAAEHGERFVERAQSIAVDRGIALVVGGYADKHEDARPFNRLTAIAADGSILAAYDKVHLYDAYSYIESDAIAPGPVNGDFSELGVFDVSGWRIGMINCYDIRFPEITRALTDRGADLITMSSAWVAGPLKELQISTLAAARAIETTSFVAIANQGGQRSTGRSSIVSPFGAVLSSLDLETGFAMTTLTDRVLNECREQLPIRANRRYASSPDPVS